MFEKVLKKLIVFWLILAMMPIPLAFADTDTWTCPKCGYKWTNENLFCGKCGNPQPKAEHKKNADTTFSIRNGIQFGMSSSQVMQREKLKLISSKSRA